MNYKQFVIVPKRPRMSPGKIASQVAHATYMALEQTPAAVRAKWKVEGMCVIVLQCEGPLQLFGISKYCEQWGIKHHLYIDEGLTEVRMGTPTALASEVLPEKLFWIFQTMRLYK